MGGLLDFRVTPNLFGQVKVMAGSFDNINRDFISDSNSYTVPWVKTDTNFQESKAV